ncbi:MAG: Tetratricopeptide repeat domain-containing protein [Parcubacteria group bacterium GW2011_GWF2_38_76]|nr:MAG: Tetratricopeptide repeat domain-containing protein [Parcubacteria group bacterium GW2011_GWF2_38_76]HBM46112.1 hypothetical protein [Patescibacteria group bacterium]
MKQTDVLTTFLAIEHFKKEGGNFIEEKKFENAIKSFDSALGCYDALPADISKLESAGILYLKAIALAELNKKEEAIDNLNKALLIDPEKLHALLYKGVILQSMNRHEESIGVFNELLEIEPEATSALHYKAISLNLLNRGKEAIEVLESIIKIDPEDKDAVDYKEKLLTKFNLL